QSGSADRRAPQQCDRSPGNPAENSVPTSVSMPFRYLPCKKPVAGHSRLGGLSESSGREVESNPMARSILSVPVNSCGLAPAACLGQGDLPVHIVFAASECVPFAKT